MQLPSNQPVLVRPYRGLFKGGLIRAGWTAIALGLYLSLYEGGRFYLENRRTSKLSIEKVPLLPSILQIKPASFVKAEIQAQCNCPTDEGVEGL
jgi:hypothetical protein